MTATNRIRAKHVDIRSLRPAELCRLLNSTAYGKVITERQLQRHRARAGLRIGDGRHIDLLRYVAWLMNVRHSGSQSAPEAELYEQFKERSRARWNQKPTASRRAQPQNHTQGDQTHDDDGRSDQSEVR